MKTWTKHSTIVATFCGIVASACTPSYNHVMTKQVQRALGGDFGGYEPFSYPTDNFGLVTAYSTTGNEVTDNDFLCDMWNCLKINPVPTDPVERREMRGFAAVGNNGGIIALTEKDTKTIAFRGALPEIYNVIGINGGFDQKKVTSTSLTLGRAYPRKLRRQEMMAYINQLPATDPLKEAFENGTLALAVADVIIDGFRAEIGVDRDVAAQLDAKFDPGLPKVKIFDGADLEVKMSSSTSGTYTFEVDQPVIILRLIKKQPEGGVLEDFNDNDWKDWSPVAVQAIRPRPVL